MNEYEIAFIIGFIFGGISIVAYFLSWACQRAWAWMDDGKMGEENWLASKASFCNGQVDYNLLALMACCVPFASLLAFKVYPVTIAVMTLIVTLILIAYLVRFSRRHKEMFDEHIKDKAAHK